MIFKRSATVALAMLSTLSLAHEFKYHFPEVWVGEAEYREGPTGCTVVYFPHGGHAAVDIRGGAAAVRESSSVSEENAFGWVDAIVLAGGSTYGLEAASGVAKELLQQRKSVAFDAIPSVPAAVVYDFRGRKNFLYPDLELGAKALREAKKDTVLVGAHGAGAHVTVGKFLHSDWSESSGQGAAFYEKGDLKILAVTVVNALGNVLDMNGKVIRGSLDPKTGQRVSINETLRGTKKPENPPKGNTTISVLVTNAPLERAELRRLAIAAHTAMARVIEPFHTPSDGDTLFAVSTASDDELKKRHGTRVDQIAALAGSLMQEAVIRAAETH